MGNRKGMLYEAKERLDGLMAIGVKRSAAKAEAQAHGETLFAFSDGRIHSYQTRTEYQAVTMRFLQWCRAMYGYNRLFQVDEQADKLVSQYLMQRIEEHKSAWTLKKERSALRLFFQNRNLAGAIDLPQRKQEEIVRSRLPAVRDQHFQPANWQPLIQFVSACGLRREEFRDLRVRDVLTRHDGSMVVQVVRGKGGKHRRVPVIPGKEYDVQQVIQERDPDALVFETIPGNMDVHAIRRSYARTLYEALTHTTLPAEGKPLDTTLLDHGALLTVSRALGHNRIEVVLTSYLS